MRNLGVTSPLALIANPVVIKQHEYKKEDNVFRVGYLGGSFNVFKGSLVSD